MVESRPGKDISNSLDTPLRGPHPRRGDVETFLRTKVEAVLDDPTTTVFPSRQEIRSVFGVADRTLTRIAQSAVVDVYGEKISLRDAMERARKEAEKRRLAQRDVEVVAWFATPRTIPNAIEIFGLSRRTLIRILDSVGERGAVEKHTKSVEKVKKEKLTTNETRNNRQEDKKETPQSELVRSILLLPSYPRRGRYGVKEFFVDAIYAVQTDQTITIFPELKEISETLHIPLRTLKRHIELATVEVDRKRAPLQAEVAKIRELVERRRIEKRDAEVVAWFTTPRTIETAATVFDLARSTIRDILIRAGKLEETQVQIQAQKNARNEAKKTQTRRRKAEERIAEKESKKFKLEPSEELAWFLGMITAAGSIRGPRNHPTAVSFSLTSNFDEGVHAALQSSARRFLGKVGREPVQKDEQDNKGRELHFDHTDFARWLGSFNGTRRVDTLREDRYAWLLEPEYIQPYLEGIFEAKGHIQIYSGKVRGAYIYVLKGHSNTKQQRKYKLEQARFYRELLMKFGLKNPLLYQRAGQKDTAMGVIVQNRDDLALLATLHSTSRAKQAKLDELRSLTAKA